MPRVLNRMILYPQGQPTQGALQERCLQYALWCGGDIARVVDSPVTSLDVYCRYVSRVRDLLEGKEQAIVILTRTNPLALAVVSLRRQLECRMPTLRTARWLIFLVPGEDPFFLQMATRLGHLSSGVQDAPVWTGPENSPYLVLTPSVERRDLVDLAVQALDNATVAMLDAPRVNRRRACKT